MKIQRGEREFQCESLASESEIGRPASDLLRGDNRPGVAEQFAEKVEKRNRSNGHAGIAHKKFPTSQAFGAISGFLAHKTGSE
jgi:hypothetical protein